MNERTFLFYIIFMFYQSDECIHRGIRPPIKGHHEFGLGASPSGTIESALPHVAALYKVKW
jgi:hypothetical protein